VTQEADSRLGLQVVERESAVLGIINEQSIPIAADHREMVRFSHIESQKFESVHFALKELIEGSPKEDLETGQWVSSLAKCSPEVIILMLLKQNFTSEASSE
jgi:hypothetical protein